MRLKLDENLPTGLATELTDRDHDADTVIDEGLAGQPHPVIVEPRRVRIRRPEQPR